MISRFTHILTTYRQFVLAFSLELFGIARFVFFPQFEWLPHKGWIDTVLALFILSIIAYFFMRAFVILKTREREPVFFVLLFVVAVGLIANVILFFARSYCVLGLFDQGKLTSDGSTCLYFSLITWTTVGFGDVTPTPSTRMLAATEAVLGYFVMAGLVGLLVVTFNKFLTADNTEEIEDGNKGQE